MQRWRELLTKKNHAITLDLSCLRQRCAASLAIIAELMGPNSACGKLMKKSTTITRKQIETAFYKDLKTLNRSLGN
jgi:hypothetical protein